MPELNKTKKHPVFVDSVVPREAKEKIWPEVAAKQKSPFVSIRNGLLKVTVLVLLIALNWFELATIGQTFAYFSDAENSLANSFSAGTLDFYLDSPSDGFEPPEIAAKMMPGDSVTRAIKIINNGSLNFQYNVKTVKVEGDDDFCAALKLKAELEGVLEYDGALLDFLHSATFFSTSTDDWFFTVILPDSASEMLQGRICQFKFEFFGWQENPEEIISFSDQEEMENVLGSEYWVLPTSKLSPLIDAYVDENRPTSNYGWKKELSVKTSKATETKRKRSFIKFGFNFPSRTAILDASLKLYLKMAPLVSRNFEVRRVLADWQEESPGGITWLNQPEVALAPTDLVSSGSSRAKWLDWDVSVDVKKFVEGTANFGWRVSDETEESRIPYQVRFRSRESNLADFRPILEVFFRAPQATTPYPVINEVYYDVAPAKRNDPRNEWVEIYNPTQAPIDISGWQICDELACDIIPPSDLIPAKGFALISPRDSTWRYWPEIPDLAVKIVLDSHDSFIGRNGLNNRGDRVILKNVLDQTIDAISYGSDTSQLNPAIPLSGEGKSLARLVKGYDTNLAKDWIINAGPNPGTNPGNENDIEVIRFTSEGAQMVGSVVELLSLSEDELLVEELAGEEEEIVLEDKQNDQPVAITDEFPAANIPEAIIEENSEPIFSDTVGALPFSSDSDVSTSSSETLPADSDVEPSVEIENPSEDQPTDSRNTSSQSSDTKDDNNQPAAEKEPIILPNNDSDGQPVIALPDDTSGSDSAGKTSSSENIDAVEISAGQ